MAENREKLMRKIRIRFGILDSLFQYKWPYETCFCSQNFEFRKNETVKTFLSMLQRPKLAHIFNGPKLASKIEFSLIYFHFLIEISVLFRFLLSISKSKFYFLSY